MTKLEIDFSGWLTLAEASRILGRTPRRVLQLADAGSLDVVVTPLGRLISRESVARRLATQHKDAADSD